MGGQISPVKEGTYKLLSAVLNEIVPAYESKFFHINADEYVSLASGPSKEMAKEIDPGGVYAYFIDRICDIIKPYDKRVMIWADVPLNFPEVSLKEINKDVIMMSWKYWRHNSFEEEIIPFIENGYDVYVCPSTNSFGNVWPRYEDAKINISNFTRDGAKYGAMGVLNTSWDDNHTESFASRWYMFVWGAECAWHPAIAEKGEDANVLRDKRYEQFGKAFDEVFLGTRDDKAANAFMAISDLRKYSILDNLGHGIFWGDAYRAVSKEQLDQAGKIVEDADKIIAELKLAEDECRYNEEALEYAIFVARMIRYSAMAKIAATVEEDKQQHIKELRQELISLKAEFERQWRLENRDHSLKENLERLDGLIEKLPQS
jgi:hypothetical protein